MEPLTVLLLLLGLTMALWLMMKKKSRLVNFPPGPPSLPLIGSYPFLPGKGFEKFLSKKVVSYGPVTGVYSGSYPTAIINDWKLAKTLFAKEEFSGRPSNHTTRWARSMGGENLGLIMTEGRRWAGQKAFTVRQLKNFGFGKKDLEVVILREARNLVSHLLTQKEQTIKIDSHMFSVYVINVLWDMMTGSAFKREDAEFCVLLDKISYIFKSKLFFAATAMPWIRFIFPSFTGYHKRVDALKSVQNLMRKEIANHKETLDEENPRDLFDTYLIEMRDNDDPEFCEEQLVNIGMDMFAAGMETTSTSLRWTAMYLALYPGVQEKCFIETTEHLAWDQELSLHDTNLLPYCQATMSEILRASMVAAASLPHRTMKTVSLPTGHILPPGTLVISNLKHFLSDPDLWDQPKIFNPERFLDSEGKFFRPEHFVPFGHGRRVCMGEPLAKAEFFIFFVSLVRAVKFLTIPGQEPDPSLYTIGVTRAPDDFVVEIQERVKITE